MLLQQQQGTGARLIVETLSLVSVYLRLKVVFNLHFFYEAVVAIFIILTLIGISTSPYASTFCIVDFSNKPWSVSYWPFYLVKGFNLQSFADRCRRTASYLLCVLLTRNLPSKEQDMTLWVGY